MTRKDRDRLRRSVRMHVLDGIRGDLVDDSSDPPEPIPEWSDGMGKRRWRGQAVQEECDRALREAFDALAGLWPREVDAARVAYKRGERP